MSPKPHAKEIKAWADGAEIQVLVDGVWQDCAQPLWCEHHQYRVNPKNVETFCAVLQTGSFSKQYPSLTAVKNSDVAKIAVGVVKLTLDPERKKLLDVAIAA